MRTFVDRGGTFTDVVTVDDGRVSIRKVRSDVAVVGALARGPLTFGTTVATNALLERSGVPTLLIVTEGFEDLVALGDQARPELFDPEARWPEPLCCSVVGVRGRIASDGSIVAALELPETWPLEGIEAVAVVLVNSHKNPAHERAVADALSGVFVALGHEVCPELGYLARIETTLVDAAISPRLQDALEADRIPADAVAMRSDGSLCPGRALRAPDAVLSGPAGGVLAVEEVARQAGFAHAVGLDMGGTSTDVCRVDVGRLPRREGDVRVAGVRLRRPMLEVETIAAGGGSILGHDGVRLSVGPASAGADPGPACYGRGGPPTLTDAALVCGLVDPEAFEPPLQPDLVVLPADAADFLEVAREAMAQAVRRIATRRGVELRDHALVAFGGAAGQHAAWVAERLQISTVLVHPCASVMSAWGQGLARREEQAVAAVWEPMDRAWPVLRAAWERLERSLELRGEVSRTADVRHAGTQHALEVAGSSQEELLASFVGLHRQRFGFDRPEQGVEVVNARVRVRGPAPEPPGSSGDPWGLPERVVGPCVVRCPTTSVGVPAGWTARSKEGVLWLEQAVRCPPPAPTERSPLAIELWSARFMAVAEEAGEVLRRLARSVNIRERLDFSVAIFDGHGRLVANAPHIPVHLGAMGQTVRSLIAERAPAAGSVWLTNDPAAGGSHLPDLTVISAVEAQGERFFVASRGHHVDVGGTTPGSMPPDSTRLEDEGVVFRHVPLTAGGGLRTDLLEVVAASRRPDVVVADLEAQVAANAHAVAGLSALGPPALTAHWMAVLQDASAEALLAVAPSLGPGRASDSIHGVPIEVSVAWTGERLRIDFSGTGAPHAGNLNAPTAVVRAAVLYVLRCLAGRWLPLNEGALRPVELIVPSPSLLAPPVGVAVVGGNVETSQRIVDVLFAALGVRASGPGTMNNLTLGGEGWSLYETLGGGEGASAAGPGASGRQVAMTNTRITDVEVVEARLPLRVRAFRLRPASGGLGVHRGGDGLVRTVEALSACSAAVLATRRHQGAPGLGGEPGQPGHDRLCIDGVWRDWDGSSVGLQPGDQVEVQTPGGGGWSPQGAGGGVVGPQSPIGTES